MRAGVAVFVDRLDGNLAQRNFSARAGEQDVHLILVAVALDAEQEWDEAHCEGPQARLRVADLRARRETVDETGQAVSEAAARRDVFSVEAAAAKDQRAGVFGCLVRRADGVRDAVLPVRVERHHDRIGAAVPRDVAQTGAERAALAAVFLVCEHDGEAFGRRKKAPVLLAAAVVDEYDLKMRVAELHDKVHKSVLRLVGRDQRNTLNFCQHWEALLPLKACFSF